MGKQFDLLRSVYGRRMPRYYFDVDDNGELTVDEVGLEFPNERAVRDEAIRALPDIAKDELPDGPHHAFWVKVRNERGVYIFQASLELKSEWLIDEATLSQSGGPQTASEEPEL